MKTPREILLQRHESANDRLNDVRKSCAGDGLSAHEDD